MANHDEHLSRAQEGGNPVEHCADEFGNFVLCTAIAEWRPYAPG